MSDLGPVNIDFVIGGNVDSEGKKVQGSLGKIGMSAKEAKQEVRAQIRELKADMKETEAAIKQTEKAISKLAPGKDKAALIEQLNMLKRGLITDKETLKDLDAQLDETAIAFERLTSKVTNAKEVLARLESAGMAGSDEWIAARANLEQLSEQLKSVNQQTTILSDPNRGFKAAVGAVSMLSGALSAGVGVASLFGAEQEKLVKIQTRLQSVMAISIGIQQVAEQLNKKSYVTEVLLVKVKELWAAANLKVATTLGVTTAAARALMFTGIGVLIAGVAALITLYSSWKIKQDEKNKALEEEARLQAELSKQIGDAYGKEMAKIEAMRAALNSENVSRKDKFDIIKKLKEQIPGYTAELNEEGRVIRENTTAISAYMVALEKSLKLRAAEKELETLFSKKYEAERKYSDAITVFEGDLSNMPKAAQNELRNKYRGQYYSAQSVRTKADAEIEAIKSYISKNSLIDISAPPGGTPTTRTPTKAQYDAELAIQKQIIEIQAQTARLQLDAMQDGLEKRLAQIDAEQEAETNKITEKEKAIIDAYNKAHKDEAGFVPATTLTETGISAEKLKQFEDEKLVLTSKYEAKRAAEIKKYGEETLKAAGEYAEKRVQIESNFQEKIDALNKRAADLQHQANKTENPELKAALEAQVKAAKDAADAAGVERNRQVSETTASMIMETEAYKAATDDKLKLNKQLTEDIIAEVQKRVDAEIAAGKLSATEGAKIMESVRASGAADVQIGLKAYIKSLQDLKKAKDDLAGAKDAQQAMDATAAMDAAEKAVDANTRALEQYLGAANFFADQAIGLLQSLSKEEGDAASSAANSIGAVMDIANSTLQGFQQGGIVGGAIALVTSTLTKVFEAEKAHQEALKKLADAKLATQEAYNMALLKQNELLERAQTIAGTDALARANAYAQQAAKFRNAENNALQALTGAQVQTGTKKTGLFGWGGEKAIYSSLLAAYPGLIDSQGRLNKELAAAVLENQNLEDSSRKALETALEYADEYEVALAGLDDYLTDIFGSLGGDLMRVITANIDSTKDVVDDFKDYMGDAMKQLISDLAYSMFFASTIQEFSDKVKKIYQDNSLSDTQKTTLAAQQMENTLKSIEATTPAAQSFISAMYDKVGTMLGTSLYDADDASRAAGIKGDVAKLTEDTGSALVGQITGMRINVAELLSNSKSSIDIMGASLAVLHDIRDNTGKSALSLGEIRDILIYLKNNGMKIQ